MQYRKQDWVDYADVSIEEVYGLGYRKKKDRTVRMVMSSLGEKSSSRQ